MIKIQLICSDPVAGPDLVLSQTMRMLPEQRRLLMCSRCKPHIGPRLAFKAGEPGQERRAKQPFMILKCLPEERFSKMDVGHGLRTIQGNPWSSGWARKTSHRDIRCRQKFASREEAYSNSGISPGQTNQWSPLSPRRRRKGGPAGRMQSGGFPSTIWSLIRIHR